jgi:hypothetical protein
MLYGEGQVGLAMSVDEVRTFLRRIVSGAQPAVASGRASLRR